MTKKQEVVSTENTNEVKTFKLKKRDDSMDVVKTLNKELNDDFKSVSEIFRYLRQNSNGKVKTRLDAKIKNDQVKRLIVQIINAGWLSVFIQWHNQIVDKDENGKDVGRYKTEPTTPVMFLNRMEKMVKEVFENGDDGMDTSEDNIRKALDLPPVKK